MRPSSPSGTTGGSVESSGAPGGTGGDGSGWNGSDYVHEALLFDDERLLRERCVPFARDGLALGQPVLVMASEPVLAALRTGLGEGAARLELLGTPDTRWQGGHETLLAYGDEFAAVISAGSCWRFIGEPRWLGRPDGLEWHRFESASNRTFADMRLHSLCLHDCRHLGEEVLRTVRQTHPIVSDRDGSGPSGDFVEPNALVPGLEPPWTPPPRDAHRVQVAGPREGRGVAVAAAAWARLDDRRDDMTVAVNELVTNALDAGGAPTITYWTDGSHFCLQVSDMGVGVIDPLAGYHPAAPGSESGRGLWLARTLADDAALRSGPAGSAVRLFFRTSPDHSRAAAS